MKKVTLAILFLSLAAYGAPRVTERDKRISRQVGKDIEQLGRRARLLKDNSIDTTVRVATGELRKHGYIVEASKMEHEWETFITLFDATDDLGDHAPLSEWLADKYDILAGLLGEDTMEETHLEDIKGLNYSIPVVFHPCDFDMGSVHNNRRVEYAFHMVEWSPKKKGGFAPIVAYWTSYAACLVGSAASEQGFSAVCGVASNGVRWFTQVAIAPPLSNAIQNRCIDRN